MDRGREAGFTLLEMIVVIAVLALAGTIVLARGPMRSSSLDVRAAARMVAAGMREARAQAIASGRPVGFEVSGGAYGLRGGTAHRLGSGVAIAPARAAILFRPDGGASGPVLQVREGARGMTVSADWLTGAVTVSPAPVPDPSR